MGDPQFNSKRPLVWHFIRYGCSDWTSLSKGTNDPVEIYRCTESQCRQQAGDSTGHHALIFFVFIPLISGTVQNRIAESVNALDFRGVPPGMGQAPPRKLPEKGSHFVVEGTQTCGADAIDPCDLADDELAIHVDADNPNAGITSREKTMHEGFILSPVICPRSERYGIRDDVAFTWDHEPSRG